VAHNQAHSVVTMPLLSQCCNAGLACSCYVMWMWLWSCCLARLQVTKQTGQPAAGHKLLGLLLMLQCSSVTAVVCSYMTTRASSGHNRCMAAHTATTHSLSLLMRPLSCVMSDLIFSLRASQDGTKLVPMEPAAISMSAESPPSAAPSSFAVALHGHRARQEGSREGVTSGWVVWAQPVIWLLLRDLAELELFLETSGFGLDGAHYL